MADTVSNNFGYQCCRVQIAHLFSLEASNLFGKKAYIT